MSTSLHAGLLDSAQDQHISHGRLIALRMQVTLPSSTYATMLIRELTKQSTATAVHKARTLAAQPDLSKASSNQTHSSITEDRGGAAGCMIPSRNSEFPRPWLTAVFLGPYFWLIHQEVNGNICNDGPSVLHLLKPFSKAHKSAEPHEVSSRL